MDLIIGGGITGLSYALFAQPSEILILEKENELGGYCRTFKRNNYVWDYSGHFFHFQDEDIKKIVFEGTNANEFKKVTKSTKIFFKDLLIDFPFQKNIHQLPKSDFIDCIYDLFSIEERDFSTFKEMLYQKFGKSIADKFLIPYNEKLYACDLDMLDSNAMGRFFPYANKEDIIRNFKNSDNSSYNGLFLYPSGGAEVYVKSLVKKIPSKSYRLNSEITNINMANHYVILSNGEKLAYDRLISTIPFPVLLDKCSINYNKDIFSWNKVLVFNLGFNKKSSNTKDHWIYFPNKEISFYRIGFYDNILESDKLSMYVEIGFSNNSIINPNEWLGRVLHDLSITNIIDSTFELVDYQSLIMDPAYVHISENSTKYVTQYKKYLEQYNIYSIGRYGSWTYCSIEDNIKEARDLVNKLNSI